MSETAPERRTPPSRPEPKGEGFFQKKYGPLPGWGWTLLAAGGAVAYFLWRRSQDAKAAAAAKQQASQQRFTASGVDIAPQLAVIQQEIQDLQGEKSKDKDRDKDKDKKDDDKGGKDHNCPPGWFWDPDAKPKPRCVNHKEKAGA